MANDQIDVLGQMVMARRVKQRLFGTSAPARGSRYVPIERIGRGGAGTVYRAYDSKLRREVAVKLLNVAQDLAIDQREATRVMMREARSLASLAHPHVVAVHDVGRVVGDDLVSGLDASSDKDAGPVFLVMEHIEGDNLASYLRKHRPSYERILELFDQAAQGLAAAHEIGLVHRDFKPGNVLVGKDGRVRVIDFGLARAQAPAPSEVFTSPLAAIQDGDPALISGIVGTPAYMSPEAQAGQTIGPKGDQFSFCVAFYEAIYGLRPMACGPDEVPARIPGNLHRLPAGTPEDLQRRLAKGLQIDPNRRYSSLAQLMESLRQGGGMRIKRWWPAVVGPVLALGAWMVFDRDLEEHCRTDRQYQALQTEAERLDVSEQAWAKPQNPVLAAVKEQLKLRLDQDRAWLAQRCGSERGTERDKRVLDARIGNIRAIIDLGKRDASAYDPWRLLAWARALAQRDTTRESLEGSKVLEKSSEREWVRCSQALLQDDVQWVQGQSLREAGALSSCASADSLYFTVEVARRSHRSGREANSALRAAYYLAVRQRRTDLATEFAVRIGNETLKNKGWMAAQSWLEHAMAWDHHAIPQERCVALTEFIDRVHLARDPRPSHYDEILQRWSADPAMQASRCLLLLEYAEEQRSRADWSGAQQTRQQIKATLEKNRLYARDGLELLEYQRVADLIMQGQAEAASTLLEKSALDSTEANPIRSALSLWATLANPVSVTGASKLNAFQAAVLSYTDRHGCAVTQGPQWNAWLALEARASRSTMQVEGINRPPSLLRRRCPEHRNDDPAKVPLDLSFSRSLLVPLKARFEQRFADAQPLLGRCPARAPQPAAPES